VRLWVCVLLLRWLRVLVALFLGFRVFSCLFGDLFVLVSSLLIYDSDPS
jgi:hypothetical protein